LVVLGTVPFAQSSAAAVLECAATQVVTGCETVLSSCCYELRTERQRFTPQPFAPRIMGLRKPPASTWSATSPWQREEGA
jgi:hypothetical protein